MDVNTFIKLFSGYFSGVPDSRLAALSNALVNSQDLSNIIAANEGNATAIAAGYYLSTGKVPVVYMQNSGIGNAVNPIASLLHNKVYGIPCIFIIGWRGEPGLHDEPQHVFQGEITLELLKVLDIDSFIIEKNTAVTDVSDQLNTWQPILDNGGSVAFVVREGAFKSDVKPDYKNSYTLNREKVIEKIASVAQEDIIISTTGKISRELFEIRQRNKQSHKYDFLTVGSMGHSASIAMAIAEQKPRTKVWCIDGDGAAIMHMGAMAVIGARKPHNMVHVVLNNAAHESVGGMPTVANDISFVKIASGCGYPQTFEISDSDKLESVLKSAKLLDALTFIEIKCSLESRPDLGRPTTTAQENKIDFMKYISGLE